MPSTTSKTVRKTKVKNHPYIERKKGVCGGEPIIRKTRITVGLIAALEKMGHSVDEIVGMYPHINHAQVFDALSYYYDNKGEIDRLIAANDIDHWQKETKNDPWRK